MKFSKLYNLLTEEIIKYDIAKEAEILNQKYFNGELRLNFPMKYAKISKAYGRVSATYRRVDDLTTITDLKISDLYNMNDKDFFLRILCHELIHVKFYQQHDPHEGHGIKFLNEIKRIKALGMDVPVSEDIDFVEVHQEKTLSKPIFAIFWDDGKIHATVFKNIPTDEEWEKFYVRFLAYNAHIHNKQLKVEIIKSTNAQFKQLPCSTNLKMQSYSIPTQIYDIVKSDIIKEYHVYPEDFTHRLSPQDIASLPPNPFTEFSKPKFETPLKQKANIIFKDGESFFISKNITDANWDYLLTLSYFNSHKYVRTVHLECFSSDNPILQKVKIPKTIESIQQDFNDIYDKITNDKIFDLVIKPEDYKNRPPKPSNPFGKV